MAFDTPTTSEISFSVANFNLLTLLKCFSNVSIVFSPIPGQSVTGDLEPADSRPWRGCPLAGVRADRNRGDAPP